MNYLDSEKNALIKRINKVLGQDSVSLTDLVYPPKPEMGDLCLPLFAVAKKIGKNPVSLAKELEVTLGGQAIGPYYNISLNQNKLNKEVIPLVLKEVNKYGRGNDLKKKKIMVEFAHPNPFKSFHIGHLRNIFLGESIVRLLENQGAKLIRTNYQGDVGMHIAKCLWSFKQVNPTDYPKTADEKVALLGKSYTFGAKQFEENPEVQKEIKEINKKIYSRQDKEINYLWNLGKKWSLEKFHEIYERVYSHFDREYMESEVMETCLKYIQRSKDKKILIDSQGAVIFSGEKYGLETRVFLNSDGLPTYDGKELGLAYKEFSDFGKLDLCLHNVAVEQISFFQVNFKVQELLDEKRFKGKQYHNAYEFVGLKSGKMSSRLGQVVLGNEILNIAKEKIQLIMKEKNEIQDLEEISEKIAVGAVKYSFLKVSPFKYLAFDFDASLSFSGDSGPYIQYTYTRILSILEKGDKKKLKADYSLLKLPKEKTLVLKLSQFNESAASAAKNYDPSIIAKYLFDLAQEFNDYYHEVPILKVDEATKLARLALIRSVAIVLENGLNLLGIKIVNKM
jgi:arginyl-tRNA synthetase